MEYIILQIIYNKKSGKIRMKFTKFLALFVLLFSFWLLLSTKFEGWFHLFFGLLSTALVTLFTYDMVFVNEDRGNNIKKLFRFALYLPWILYQIILANVDVAKRVLDPKMPIDPDMITFKSVLKTDLSKTTLANSITLTPGTVTIDIDDDTFLIHAIAKEPADDLLEGTMEKKVAHVFMEDK
ncbi:MAG: multicomponent Na+:H+ antiporter subunit E [Candidatus Methanocomedens sp.]|nr:MAG: multicomponent Na+:H+ antiporter subunit E [ANME-2 cluster archaeon]